MYLVEVVSEKKLYFLQLHYSIIQSSRVFRGLSKRSGLRPRDSTCFLLSHTFSSLAQLLLRLDSHCHCGRRVELFLQYSVIDIIFQFPHFSLMIQSNCCKKSHFHRQITEYSYLKWFKKCSDQQLDSNLIDVQHARKKISSLCKGSLISESCSLLLKSPQKSAK